MVRHHVGFSSLFSILSPDRLRAGAHARYGRNDDTMFVDTKSILHMLAKYDPSEPVIVGSFSDLRADHSDVPHLDAGGGIFISAAAMDKMSSGSKLDECVRLFGNVVNGKQSGVFFFPILSGSLLT